MHSPSCFAKTAQAREWLQRRDGRLDRARRSLLITVDGQRPRAALDAIAGALGLPAGVLDELEALGLIHFPALAALQPVPARPRAESLAAAKMYAVDLATRMLAGNDAALRAKAVAIDSRDALLDWCGDCMRAIASQAGPSRAEVFWAKVKAVLPAEAAELATA